MDINKIINEKIFSDYPIGIFENQTFKNISNFRKYDLVVFDGHSDSDIFFYDDTDFLTLHHGSLIENQSKKLLQYSNLKIIRDESWELQMFLSKIQKNLSLLYSDFGKNCLIESIFCCQKAQNAIESGNEFGSCWQKCASYFLAEAISAMNHFFPDPIYLLYFLRNLQKNLVNENIPNVIQTTGIERSTPILLERILKSSMGFSDEIKNNTQTKNIQKNHDFFVKNSMLSDCYFYLGYVNKENFYKIKNELDHHPEFIHILKIAFDIEADTQLILQHVRVIENSCKNLIKLFSEEQF